MARRSANPQIISADFRENTCDGANVNPPVKVEGIPDGTKRLVLIVDDPDAPMGTWDHWVVWNIAGNPSDTSILDSDF